MSVIRVDRARVSRFRIQTYAYIYKNFEFGTECAVETQFVTQIIIEEGLRLKSARDRNRRVPAQLMMPHSSRARLAPARVGPTTAAPSPDDGAGATSPCAARSRMISPGVGRPFEEDAAATTGAPAAPLPPAAVAGRGARPCASSSPSDQRPPVPVGSMGSISLGGGGL